MKIAFFHELPLGGARRAISEFAKYLKSKYKIDLYYVDDVEHKEEYNNYQNVFYFKFNSKKWLGHNWKTKIYTDTVQLFRLFLLHKKIAEKINKRNYDLVFINGSKYTQAPFLLRFIKSKKIYYCQEPLRMAYEAHLSKLKLDFPRRLYENLNRLIRKKIDSVNLGKATLVLVNSYFTKKNILSSYGIKSNVCYMGVDTSLFSPKKISKNIDILFVGSKDFLNGYPLFRESIKKINNKKMNVKYLTGEKEWLKDDDLINLYNRSKIIVSLGYNEPFGLVPLEAMACGTPIIAIDEGGYRETVVNGQTGFLVPRISKVIAEKIKLLLSNSTIARKFGENGRRRVLNNWTWGKRIINLESFLLEAKK